MNDNPSTKKGNKSKSEQESGSGQARAVPFWPSGYSLRNLVNLSMYVYNEVFKEMSGGWDNRRTSGMLFYAGTVVRD